MEDEDSVDTQQKYAAAGIAAFIGLLMLLMVFPTNWNAFTTNVANFMQGVGSFMTTIGHFITGSSGSSSGPGMGTILLVTAAAVGTGVYYYTQNKPGSNPQ